MLNDWLASKARKSNKYRTSAELEMHGLAEILKLPVISHALVDNFGQLFPQNQEIFNFLNYGATKV